MYNMLLGTNTATSCGPTTYPRLLKQLGHFQEEPETGDAITDSSNSVMLFRPRRREIRDFEEKAEDGSYLQRSVESCVPNV